MMRNSRTLAIVVGSLVVRAVSLGAQQRDTTVSDSARKLVPVTVTESRAVGATGGASAVVIDANALRASPAPVLEQALRESPFVHVRQNSRGEMELSIRGSDSRQAAVLLDGVPITLGFDHRTDPSLVPLTGAQYLTIVRGLSSLLNGPNTLGGTIEVSHDDAFGRLGNGRVWGGAGVDENAAFAASLGGGREVDLTGGTLTMRAGLAHRVRDGFTLPSGVPDPTSEDGLRTNSDMRESDGFGSIRWAGPSGRSIAVLVSAFDAARGVPPEEHLVGPRLWRYPYHSRVLATFSASAGTFATPFGLGSFDGGVGYNAGRSRIDIFSDRTYSSVIDAELGDERTWTGRARFTHSLPAGAQLRVAATGAVVNYDETLIPDPVARYQQRLWSGGAEVDIPLGAVGRTSVSGGVVYDRSTTPATGGRTPGQEPFDDIGWRAGVTHDLTTHTRLHASASQRSRFPALRELYSGAANRFVPNPDLKPETLLGFEAGFTIDRAFGVIPDATIQATVFHHDLEDAVVRITLPDPDRRFQRVNRDRIRSRGIELLGGIAFSSDPQRAITLTGDATIQDISISDQLAGGIRRAENNPELRGMLELGVPVPARLRAFANARYTGTQYCLNADSGGEMTLPGRAQSNVALERRYSLAARGAVRALRALLALDNVTNAAIYDQCGLPQAGRTLRLMFTFE